MRIPEGWEKTNLAEKLLVLKDGTHFSPQSKSGSFMYLTSKNIRFGKLDLSNVSYISEEEHKKIYKGSSVKYKDVLLTKDGANTGNAAINNIKNEFSLLSSVAFLRGKTNVLSNDFLLQLILSPIGQSTIKSEMAGQAITRLTLKKIGGLFFLFPSYPEQQKIAQILFTWDRAIEKLEALIDAKQKRKKALMQQLLTGKKRFSGFNGTWKDIKLGAVFNEIKDKNDGDDSHSIMTISSRLGLISQEDKFDRVIAGDSLKRYTQLKRTDFAYNKGNSKSYEMGCIYQLEDRESALVPFVYICFSPTDTVCSTFYKHWFLAHGLDRQLKKIITSGARGDGLLNVSTDDFFSLKIPFPTKEEQMAIAKVLQAADKEIVTHQNQLAALKQQKKGLMQLLLTGKKRVNVNQAAA